MAAVRTRLGFLLALALLAGCTSATDRLNDGIALQAQGRYMDAAYRYADAVERDGELVEARERLLAVGDSAIMVSMDGADDLDRRGDPVAAARLYQSVDRLLGRVRQVGMRLEVPAEYQATRRSLFDKAIGWQMAQGHEARQEGRWADAKGYYRGAREASFQPVRLQVEESYDAETDLLLEWAGVELGDGRPRAAHGLAQQALEVRSSPPRNVVLEVRELQDQALEAGTVVVAMLPATAAPGVRDYVGPEFEMELDNTLQRDHWNQPPPFVQSADPLILRSELRGLLRGTVPMSPMIVGRTLDLIGADLGIMVGVSTIDVKEEDVGVRRKEVEIPTTDAAGVPRRGDEAATERVAYRLVEGTLAYYVEADIAVVDASGREVERFTASASHEGPFRRGEFEGDPRRLPLNDSEAEFFDPRLQGEERALIERALVHDLAVAIATGTYDTVLRGIL